MELNVPKKILIAHGAVSEPVAAAMAKGARQKAGTDYAIGITGIAGPQGGTETKPAGLVFIGIAGPRGCRVRQHMFSRDRRTVRRRAAQQALYDLRQELFFDLEGVL